jgi:hypothetical protein
MTSETPSDIASYLCGDKFDLQTKFIYTLNTEFLPNVGQVEKDGFGNG